MWKTPKRKELMRTIKEGEDVLLEEAKADRPKEQRLHGGDFKHNVRVRVGRAEPGELSLERLGVGQRE